MFHTKILQPKAMPLRQMPFFHDAAAGFVESLELGSGRCILASGEAGAVGRCLGWPQVVYQKGRASSTRDLYCVARGVVRVVRANVDSGSDRASR